MAALAAADEFEDVRHAAFPQRRRERGDVVAAVGEDDGRAPLGDGRGGVRGDGRVARFVEGQLGAHGGPRR